MRDTASMLDIFEDETGPKYGESLQVRAVRELIADIRANGQMTPAKQVMCATALRLAELVEHPKSAIASVQAASQLTPLIEKLTEADGDAAGMSEETRDLIRALTIDPQTYAQPAAGDTAEPAAGEPGTP